MKKQFGKTIKQLRTRAGYSQYRLAEIIGVDGSYISKLETAKSCPSKRIIMSLSQVLNVNCEWLALIAGKVSERQEDVLQRLFPDGDTELFNLVENLLKNDPEEVIKKLKSIQ